MNSADRGSVSADVSPIVAADAKSSDGTSAVVPIYTVPSTSLDEPFTRFPSPSDLGNLDKVLAFSNQLLIMMILLQL